MNELSTVFCAYLLTLNLGSRNARFAKMVAANPANVEAGASLIGENYRETFAGMSKTAIFRTVEALHYIASGDFKFFDKVTGAMVSHVLLNDSGKRVSFGDVRFALSGKGDDDSKHLPGINSARLRKVVGSVHSGTVGSQTSRTVGSGGFFNKLGITRKGDKNGFEVADKAHPFVLAYAVALSKADEGTLIKNLVKDETEQ